MELDGLGGVAVHLDLFEEVHLVEFDRVGLLRHGERRVPLAELAVLDLQLLPVGLHVGEAKLLHLLVHRHLDLAHGLRAVGEGHDVSPAVALLLLLGFAVLVLLVLAEAQAEEGVRLLVVQGDGALLRVDLGDEVEEHLREGDEDVFWWPVEYGAREHVELHPVSVAVLGDLLPDVVDQGHSDTLQVGGLLGFLQEDELYVLEARGLEAVRGDVHHGAVRRHGEVRLLQRPRIDRGLVVGNIYLLCGMVWCGVLWYGVVGCGVVRSVVVQ